MNRGIRLLLGVLFAVCPRGGAAQWPPDLSPGVRVQIRIPEAQFQANARRGHLLRGQIVQLGTDTLYLAVTDSLGALAIPRSYIRQLDRSRGVPSRGTSALRRGAILAVGTAALTMLTYGLEDDPYLSAGEAALVGAGVGFAVGAVFGALRPEERWRRIRLDVTAPAPF